MPEQKNPSVKQAVESALEGVAICRSRIVALHYVIHGLGSRGRGDESLGRAIETINARLYEELSEAYKRLFMWGVIDDEARTKAAEAAASYYLAERSDVMKYLFPDPRAGTPPSYFARHEKELRREIAERIAKGSKP
jgi:hypothetical protein